MAQKKQRLDQDSPGEALSTLTRYETRILEAVAERIFPPTDTPGAVEAGAISYIDKALAGAYRPLLPKYRRGLRELNRYAQHTFDRPFADLAEPDQDAILTDLEEGRGKIVRNGAEFFLLVRSHVLEGVFGEPIYGGNRHLAGWRLVGFPGQRYGYRDAYINRVVDLPPVAEANSAKEEK